MHVEPNEIRTIFHVLYVMRFVKENTFFTIFRAFAVYFMFVSCRISMLGVRNTIYFYGNRYDFILRFPDEMLECTFDYD